MNAISSNGNDAGAEFAPGDLVAFVIDEILRDVVSAFQPGAIIHDGGPGAAAAGMAGSDASVVFVELPSDSDPVKEVQALRKACRPSARIIAAGAVNDVTLYHRLIEAGAEDYLLTPVAPDIFSAALRRVSKQSADETAPSNPMHTIMVTGVRGGAGVTTFATGLAWQLAEVLSRKVALIDLDLHFGTVALGLDLEPSHGLKEILESPERIDALFVKSSLSQATENLSVLAAEESLDSPTVIRASAFERLAMALSEDMEYLIVDAPGEVLMAEPDLFGQIDSLVVVSEMSLAAIRDILRLAAFARDSGFDKTLTIVGNKSTGKGPVEVEKKEFSRGINLPVDMVLPLDVKTVCEAARAGRPINEVAPKSPLVAAIAEATLKLTALEEAPAKSGFWNRLTSRG